MTDRSAPRARRGPMHWLWRVLVVLLLAYAGWCAVLYFMQEKLIFPRHLAGPPTPKQGWPPGVESITLPIEGGGTVEAWFHPVSPAAFSGKNRGTHEKRPAVIIAHGNGELIDHLTDYAERWLSMGYHVLMPEYRGFGRSDGRPLERDIVADYERFHDLLAARPDVDPARIVFHGRSLGSGVVSQLAMRRRPAAIVLESPFLSVAAMAKGYGAPGFLVRSPFRSDKALPRLGAAGVPVLILHSPDDEIIPYWHGTRLAEITPGSRLVDLSGSHVSNLAGLPQYWEAVEELIGE